MYEQTLIMIEYLHTNRVMPEHVFCHMRTVLFQIGVFIRAVLVRATLAATLLDSLSLTVLLAFQLVHVDDKIGLPRMSIDARRLSRHIYVHVGVYFVFLFFLFILPT